MGKPGRPRKYKVRPVRIEAYVLPHVAREMEEFKDKHGQSWGDLITDMWAVYKQTMGILFSSKL